MKVYKANVNDINDIVNIYTGNIDYVEYSKIITCLLKEVKIILKENNIDISYERVIVESPTNPNISVSARNKRKAENFVDEQASLSEGMDDQQR